MSAGGSAEDDLADAGVDVTALERAPGPLLRGGAVTLEDQDLPFERLDDAPLDRLEHPRVDRDALRGRQGAAENAHAEPLPEPFDLLLLVEDDGRPALDAVPGPGQLSVRTEGGLAPRLAPRRWDEDRIAATGPTDTRTMKAPGR